MTITLSSILIGTIIPIIIFGLYFIILKNINKKRFIKCFLITIIINIFVFTLIDSKQYKDIKYEHKHIIVNDLW